MFQHCLHDTVGTFPVLSDLLQVAGQHGRDIIDLRTLIVGQSGKSGCGGFLQFAQSLSGNIARPGIAF